MKPLQRKKLQRIAIWSASGILLGVIFPAIADDMELQAIRNGMVIGFLIGFFGALFEFFVFQERVHRMRFSAVLILRTVFYLLLISLSSILTIALYQSGKEGVSLMEAFRVKGFREFLNGGEFLNVVAYSVIAGLVISFIRQVNRLLGQRVLLNYITGKYHQPVEEERIFMFLDINSSTSIAERLGHIAYHRLLNDFFYDITEPIVECKGEIYQYVGDEVVVTWTMKRGVPHARCVACFFKIRDRIDELGELYMAKYGVVPGFKAGLHYGPVVTAEVGDIKKEIVFHGDVVNTASRIQAACRSLNRDILLSAALLDQVQLGDEYSREDLGSMRLRGKEKEIELVSLDYAPMEAIEVYPEGIR